jgi:hypothetical protein
MSHAMKSESPLGWVRGTALLVLLAAACASQSDLNVLYNRGIKAARRDDWEVAMKDLSQFSTWGCWKAAPDRRCREAYLALGRGHERAGAPAKAWASYDRALALPPHERDATVEEQRARAQQQVVDKLQQGGDRGPVVIRYRDEVPDEYTLKSVVISIDFQPVVARDKNAADLHSPDFAQVFASSLPAGQHVLVLEAVHSCKTGQDVPCTRSAMRRAFAFDSAAHTPTTLQLRAYADAGEGGAPAIPVADMTTH